MKNLTSRNGAGKGRIGLAALGITLLVVMALMLAVAACGGGSTATTAAPGSTGGTTGAAGVSVQVALQGFAFSPQTVTIKVGGTVTWTNKDPANHTVVADGGTFQSGDLADGATFSFTFGTAGTFAYHCSVHPSMTGTVIVQ